MTKNHHHIVSGETDYIVGKIPTEAARRQSLATTFVLLIILVVVMMVPYKETVEAPATITVKDGNVECRANVGKDYERIAVGQNATISLDDHTTRKYGTQSGCVSSIKYNYQKEYLEVKIRLTSSQIIRDKNVMLLPHITGTARIVTGQKPLVRWLLPS